jgi:regulator of protease activity HflC (stomatin/prohibitin superfamily)
MLSTFPPWLGVAIVIVAILWFATRIVRQYEGGVVLRWSLDGVRSRVSTSSSPR